MAVYIALLRGINVSGKNIIKMADLRILLEKSGLSDVRTYIQSGNVIFNCENEAQNIEELIHNAIKKQYGYDVNVLVLTNPQIETIFNSNPFIESNSNVEIKSLCVVFLNNEPKVDEVSKIENLISKSDDEFIIKNKTVYLHCPNGFGRTKLTNNLFEKKLNSPATSRNWKTITKLIELSS